jgi:3-hydroxybutyryl-CoA dehydrogenase
MSSTQAQVIGIVGAGAMGRGIAQLFAESGHRVHLYDAATDASSKARQFVAQMLDRAREKGKYSDAQVEAVLARVQVAASLADLRECNVIIEAIVEDLDIKRAMFAALEAVVPHSTLLVSNTSSLVIAEIAAACRHPQRVAGLHFFNPVPLMKVVEIIAAVRTASATVAKLRELVASTGHLAVTAADQPGFLINHAGRGYYTEALRILEEQVASVEDIDVVLREVAGFRMGPFELLDLTGLDVSSKVMQSIFEQFQYEPRFRPSSLVRPRVAAGLFGRKSGQGWHVYEGDRKRASEEERAVPKLASGARIWIDPNAEQANVLGTLALQAGAQVIDRAADADVAIVQFLGRDATSFAVENALDAERCVAVDPLFGLVKRRTLMLTAVTSPAARDIAHAVLAADGAAVTPINDSPGFIVQRVLATIVNIAAEIAQRGIASANDIDAAVQLGLGYPKGPLSWGDRIGGKRIVEILRAMQAQTGDPRYRPSQWLARRVALGISLLTPEAAR